MNTTLPLIVVCPILLNAQVGIGIANPTASLHIGGNDSTIRIESLDQFNYPTFNDGIKPSYSYVTADGDITINPSTNNGTGPGGEISPINFLNIDQNFIPNGSKNFGTIINNDTNTTNTFAQIFSYPFATTHSSLVEVKYSISSVLSNTDLNTALTPFNDLSARVYKIYFYIDLNDDGLDAAELSKKYGLNAQSYSSFDQGILGYAYTNGQGYATIPAGNHSLKFFAEIVDGQSKYTSVGFGGNQDFLRIRIYN